MVDRRNPWPSRQGGLENGGFQHIPIDIPRRETLKNLWDSLKEFEKRMSNFFDQGFATDFLALEFSPEYSDKFVVATISSQVGHDMEVLTRAMGQRTVYNITDDYERVAKALQLADLIAYHVALKPAIDAGLIPPTTVVTYFEKSVNMRVIPYAPVALIAFPFRAIPANLSQVDSAPEISNLADLLAIPHEIGHYVYWHSSTNGRRSVALLKMMFGKPQWVQNWLEEIYADIYGYVIAGHHAAGQLMRLLQSVSRAGLFYDDGEHPVPVLRLHAAVIALEKLNLCETATQLEKEWQAWLSLRPHETGFHPATAEEFVTWENAKPVITEVVATIVTDIFADLLQKNIDNQERIISNKQDVQKSFNNKFLQVIAILQASPEQEGKIPEYQIIEEQASLTEVVTRSVGKTETWIDQFLELDPTNNAFSSLKLPVTVWMEILEARGWVTVPTGPGNLKDYQ
jgi:hypothetical protein